MWLLGWILIIAALTFYFSSQEERTVVQYSPEGDIEVVIPRRFGHYEIDGEINGVVASMMVDTGATSISIPEALADQMNLERGREIVALTAGGPIAVYQTRIDRLRLGEIVLYDVRATINPEPDVNSVLLGMSALAALEFEQRGNTLVLRQRGRPKG